MKPYQKSMLASALILTFAPEFLSRITPSAKSLRSKADVDERKAKNEAKRLRRAARGEP